MKQLTIDEHSKGKRLDIYISGVLPELSRSYISRLIDSNKILLNNKPQKAGYKLKTGDIVNLDFDQNELEKIESIELPIIYENEDIIVIDKPAGVISHSRGKYWYEPSVASFMREYTKQDGDRPGIVHRLDRATSGVMICAKNPTVLSFLQKQFSERKVIKHYCAVIKGTLRPPEAIIDVPLSRNPNKPTTFMPSPEGKSAQTKYSISKTSDNYSLVSLSPITGRTHQLRVHLMYLNHPIVGDELYGGEKANRLMLHSDELTITIPGGEKRTFNSALPKEFLEYIK